MTDEQKQEGEKKEEEKKEEVKKDQGKAEEIAEKSGKLIGKGLKKGVGVVKAFGRGAKKALKDKEEEKKSE